jgi:hypothetical protein
MGDIQVHVGVDPHDFAWNRDRLIMDAKEVDIGHFAEEGILIQQ